MFAQHKGGSWGGAGVMGPGGRWRQPYSLPSSGGWQWAEVPLLPAWAGTGMAAWLSRGQLHGTGFHHEGKVEPLLWRLLMPLVPHLWCGRCYILTWCVKSSKSWSIGPRNCYPSKCCKFCAGTLKPLRRIQGKTVTWGQQSVWQTCGCEQCWRLALSHGIWCWFLISLCGSPSHHCFWMFHYWWVIY